MRKLSDVEYAKQLMTEAMDWSVLRWLWEKPAVREAADKANAALDRLHRKIRAGWRDDIKAAYEEFEAQDESSGKGRGHKSKSQEPKSDDSEAAAFAKKAKQAHDKAYRARMDAEDTFDDAERQLNTGLAREGCQKAIQSWELFEKAIRVAQGGLPASKEKA
jgi:hypothetical protein